MKIVACLRYARLERLLDHLSKGRIDLYGRDKKKGITALIIGGIKCDLDRRLG